VRDKGFVLYPGKLTSQKPSASAASAPSIRPNWNKPAAIITTIRELGWTTRKLNMQGYQHLEAVIFDWAGTVVDFGSLRPHPGSDRRVRRPGHRGEHGRSTHPHGPGQVGPHQGARSARVAARWQARFGSPMQDADVDRLYQQFMPLQVERVGDYSAPIPGAIDTINQLRARGLKIGSCSGYPRVVMDRLLPLAAAAGYAPDHTVATDDLPAGGRPGPWMALAMYWRWH
jgi:phosphonoacetaldehyde hydrolase